MKSIFEEYMQKLYNEEMIDQRINNEAQQIFELYKNPQTLKKFMPFARGILTPGGDLYIVDYNFDTQKNHDVYIHSDIVEWLNEKHILDNCTYEEGDDPVDYIDEFLAVERLSDTNEFLLAESYPEDVIGEFSNEIRQWERIWNQKQKVFTLHLKQFE